MKRVPIKSKSGIFYERYAASEIEAVRTQYMLAVLGGVSLVLALALAAFSLSPRPVHYIPGAVQAGISFPGKVPAESAAAFAASWILDWMNYTPETIESVYERAFKQMGPGLLSRARSGFEDERQKVLADRLASSLTLSGQPTAREENSGFTVVCEGRRTIYMGREEMSSRLVRYRMQVRRVPPGKDNPWGLAVEEIVVEGDAADGH